MLYLTPLYWIIDEKAFLLIALWFDFLGYPQLIFFSGYFFWRILMEIHYCLLSNLFFQGGARARDLPIKNIIL